MPISVQYLTPQVSASATLAAFPTLALMFGSFMDCAAPVQDQIYFLGVLERAYPLDYFLGLQRTQNSGFELLAAVSRVGERVSLAIARLECGGFVITATGPARATGTLEIWKTDATALTIRLGSTFSTDFGQVFATTEDVVFTPSSLGPFAVPIAAVQSGYEYNVPGETLTRAGEIVPGEIRNINALIVTPNILDTTIQIRQVLPTLGGRPASLDGLAADLGLSRKQFEDDDEFRLRIKSAPDTVTPNAIIRAVNALLQKRDPSFTCVLREVGGPLLPGMFYDAGSSADMPQDPTRNFAYDMNPALRPDDYWKMLFSRVDFRGFFLVEVPKFGDVRDFGLTYDGTSAAAFARRNAYDTTSSSAPDSVYDGFQTFSNATYQAIWATVADKVAGGVGFRLILTPTISVFV